MFTPPKELERIIHSTEKTEITLSSFGKENEPVDVLDRVKKIMDAKYNLSPSNRHRILLAFWEALTNASDHGNQNDPEKNITIGCWFSEKVIVFAFRDKGNFFTVPRNKKVVESRILLPSTRKNPSGEGMELIYSADAVFVNTDENALYVAFLID